MVSKSFQWFLLLFLPLLVTFSSSSDQFLTECPTETANYTSPSQFETNMKELINSLVTKAPLNNGFYNTTVGRNSDEAYGLAQCRGDISPSDCSSCLNTSRSEITTMLCPNKKDATVRYDYCVLRYSNQNFFSTVSSRIVVYGTNTANVSDPAGFNQLLGELMNDLSIKAVSDPSGLMFAAGEKRFPPFQNIYGMVQCTRDLLRTDCNSCLVNAINQIAYCCNGKQGAHIAFVSCDIRYEIYPFIKSSPAPPPPPPLTPPPPPPPPRSDENSTNSTTTAGGQSPISFFASFLLIKLVDISA